MRGTWVKSHEPRRKRDPSAAPGVEVIVSLVSSCEHLPPSSTPPNAPPRPLQPGILAQLLVELQEFKQSSGDHVRLVGGRHLERNRECHFDSSLISTLPLASLHRRGGRGRARESRWAILVRARKDWSREISSRVVLEWFLPFFRGNV